MELDRGVADAIIKNLQPFFLETLGKEYPKLKKGLDGITKETPDIRTLEPVRVIVHDLAGAAQTYGFPEITELGRAFENCFKRLEGKRQGDAPHFPRFQKQFMDGYRNFLRVLEDALDPVGPFASAPPTGQDKVSVSRS